MRIAIIMLGLLLSGCAATAPRTEIRTVTNTVKVPTACNPKQPEEPASAVDSLPLNAEIDEQMRALRADRVRNRAYTSQLRGALASCKQ